MNFWKDKRVLLTGGRGFLGSYVLNKLKENGCVEIAIPNSKHQNLLEIRNVKSLLSLWEPNIVIHLAAKVGGIGANQEHPGTFFYENMQMGINILEGVKNYNLFKKEAYSYHLETKVVMVGTVCSYPKFCSTPFLEESLWRGYPEETNAPYGIAKRALLTMAQAYRQEYGLNTIYLIPTNLYGPRDHFDPEVSHVIPALIKRFYEAKRDGLEKVVIWGTGNATRDFLYAEDAAEAILLAAEKYNGEKPVNLGSDREIKVSVLAEMIANMIGYDGKIVFDPTKPDGQPSRLLNTLRAKVLFGFEAKTKFEDGLAQTIKWYEEVGHDKNL